MPRSYIRRSSEEWSDLVRRQRESGLSVAAFARQESVPYQSLAARCRTQALSISSSVTDSVDVPVPTFIELGVAHSGDGVAQKDTATVSANDWLVELDLGNGVQLRVRQPD